jgi:hypothetical protein
MGGTRFPGGYAPYPHGEQIEGLASCPHPPREPRAGGGREPVRPWAIFSETPNVANPAARNMTHINSQHRWKLISLDVAWTRFATLNNVFCNILKVFRNIERMPPPDRWLIEAFIQILRLRIRPTLAPGSDVRALAVLYRENREVAREAHCL